MTGPTNVLAWFERVRRDAPVLTGTLILWVVVELVAAIGLPLVVPDTLYLDWYLPQASSESVEQFFAGNALIVPDRVTGWRTAPDRSRENWVTDSNGARSTSGADWDDEDAVRILALGSSMMNGGTRVTNAETITAYLETDGVRTANHGTMLFGLDQSLLAFRDRWSRLRPDVVLVGLDEDPYSPLTNVYVPLRRRDEIYIPFVKPRFELEPGPDGDPVLRPVRSDPWSLLPPSERDELLAHIRRHDAYASRLDRYERYSITPLLSTLDWVVTRIENLLGRWSDPAWGVELLDRLMAQMVEEARAVEAGTCFVAMPPTRVDLRRLPGEPDLFARRVAHWREFGHCVIDGRDALTASGRGLDALYLPDGVHLSPVGNRVLADRIAARLLSDR